MRRLAEPETGSCWLPYQSWSPESGSGTEFSRHEQEVLSQVLHMQLVPDRLELVALRGAELLGGRRHSLQSFVPDRFSSSEKGRDLEGSVHLNTSDNCLPCGSLDRGDVRLTHTPLVSGWLSVCHRISSPALPLDFSGSPRLSSRSSFLHFLHIWIDRRIDASDIERILLQVLLWTITSPCQRQSRLGPLEDHRCRPDASSSPGRLRATDIWERLRAAAERSSLVQ